MNFRFNFFYSKKLRYFFLLLSLNFIMDFNPAYPMNEYHQPSREEVEREARDLVTSTPTGFTFLVRSCASKMYSLVTISWQMVRHPISSTIAVCSRVCGSTLSIAGGGAKKGLQVAQHPVETTKMVINITIHPIRSVSQFISLCDNIVVDDLPLIGGVSQGLKQFSGLVKITPDSCPYLYSMFSETAHRLGYENAGRVYVFKGNFITKMLESMGILDDSCNAFHTGLTRGTEYTYG